MFIKRLRGSSVSLIVQLSCLVYSLVVLIPVLWSLISSFRSSLAFFTDPFGIPSPWKYQNFVYAWNQANVAIYFRNSVFVTTVSVTVIILLSAMASFALSRLKFRGRTAVLFLFISGLFVPAALLLLPLFLMLQDLHVLGRKELEGKIERTRAALQTHTSPIGISAAIATIFLVLIYLLM